MKIALSYLLLPLMLLTSSSIQAVPTAAERGIQVTEVHFGNQTITLTNLNASDSVTMTGWRFCSHDEDEIRRYSATGGLSAVTLAAGENLVIHFLNDAGGATGHINISTIGGSFAVPLDSGAYAIQLYDTGAGFGNGTLIVDHLQWSIDGIDNTNADERSDEADLEGNVWTDQSAWIATTAESIRLILTNPVATAIEQGPGDYTVIEPVSESIEVSNIVNSGSSVTADVASSAGNVDVYRSSDLQDFGETPITSDLAPGTGITIDGSPPATESYYRLVPTGTPAP